MYVWRTEVNRKLNTYGLHRVVAVCLFILSVAWFSPQPASAQGTDMLAAPEVTDPGNKIYRYYELWRDAGLLDELPHVMPYPLQVHVELLRKVIAKGRTPELDRKKAEGFLEYLRPRGSSERAERGGSSERGGGAEAEGAAGVEGEGSSGEEGASGAETSRGFSYIQLKTVARPYITDGTNRSEELGDETEKGYDRIHGEGGMGISAGGFFAGNASLAVDWLGFGKDENHPSLTIDTFEDNAQAGFGGRTIDLRQNFNNIFAIGGPDFYFQSGIARAAMGPAYGESPVLSGQAGQLPQFIVAYDGGAFTYTSTYLELTASNFVGEERFPGKHMFVQSLSWQPPLEGLELSLYQTSVWGGRFDLNYFVPFSFLFYNQSLNGFEDNSLLGGALQYDFPKGLSYKTVGYVDDADFNKLARLDFGGKSKLVWDNRISLTPLQRWMRRLELSYTIITPYMYTHKGDRFVHDNYDNEWDLEDDTDNSIEEYYQTILEGEPNYKNYTHAGDSLGVQLKPNSDRLALKYHARPFPGFLVMLGGSYTRHANATQDLEGSFDSNPGAFTEPGSIYDDGYNDDRRPGFNSGVGFLDQSPMERTAKAEGTLGYTRSFGSHQFAVAGTLIFSHVENAGLVKNETEKSLHGLISLIYQVRLW